MSVALKMDFAPEALDESVPANVVRVLLIDDDPAYTSLCRRYLTRETVFQYDLVAVSTAAAGIEACKTQRFDCLLIDYSLPDICGTELIHSLRTMFKEAIAPVIILTAGGGESAAAESVRAGATDFLPKSVVSVGSLSRAINNAVEKGRLRKSVELRSEELQQANNQLESKNEEIQRFYQSVSHEVKTPLAAAREFIAIALDGIVGPENDKQKEILGYALDSCDQITAHFNELVEVTRLDAGKVILNKQLGSLDAVVARCFASMASAVEAKQLYVKRQIEPSLLARRRWLLSRRTIAAFTADRCDANNFHDGEQAVGTKRACKRARCCRVSRETL